MLAAEPEVLLIDLYKKTFGNSPKHIERLPRSGSTRVYYRIYGDDSNVIGTFNANREENEAFVYMSEFFEKKGLNVPHIFAYEPQSGIYLQTDLGDTTLFDLLSSEPENIYANYVKVLNYLLQFQTSVEDFDWSKTYPVPKFDKTAYLFDLNYFKYMVLKLNNINFHELRLQREFERLVEFILMSRSDFFVYRDFQSKNIMFHESDFYFIDYQGGRKGNLFYDLASLLYDSKANLSDNQREELKNYYYRLTWQLHQSSGEIFDKFFYANVLIRKLQAFAAYSLRGSVEHKTHFLTSIPYVLEDLTNLLHSDKLPFNLPELTGAIRQLAVKFPKGKRKLNVNLEINSFSYHQLGYPEEKYGNGGGFVFDCRSLPNPGRLIQFKYMSGLDEPVKKWIEAHPEFEIFLGYVFKIVSQALVKYNEEGYKHLQVNFGCTGGQHRSVYCAEKLAEMISEYYDLAGLTVNHLMKGRSWGDV